MSQWRCPHCEAELTKGRGGNVSYKTRRDANGRISINQKTGRPNFDAYCKECLSPCQETASAKG